MKGLCMTTTKTPDSPCITSLQQAIASGNTTALATFWQEITEQGAPLIEPIEGDDNHHLVTFLWRDKGETHNVVVFAGSAGYGLAYLDAVPTPTILDNLVGEGKIPPLVTVLPDSLDQETRNRELPCHKPFVEFLTQELMPWVHEHYHVTSDPAQTIVGGSSYGGLAAALIVDSVIVCSSAIYCIHAPSTQVARGLRVSSRTQ
jgi:hypothetical protein